MAVVGSDDGSVVFAGFTDGDWDGSQAGEGDFAAAMLDSEGSVVWRWQVTLR